IRTETYGTAGIPLSWEASPSSGSARLPEGSSIPLRLRRGGCHFPDWLLARFDKADLEAESRPETTDEDVDVPDDPEVVLVENGIVSPCEDVDDLCLEASVRADWRSRMDELRDGDRTDQLAAFVDVAPEKIDLEEDGHVTARVGSLRVGRWESDAAVLADLAAHHVLASRIAGWESIPPRNQGAIAAGLRAFAETCPSCDGSISITEDTIESCCRSYDVHAITCDECSATILEVSQ
ncbi:hypothetical protein ACYJ1Y_00005, partial [Natrialbaceae archaeon A-gly3]